MLGTTVNYRPEIDGLRAIAVLAVITFHSGLLPLDGGYLGVDVFFVISGYLITTILLSDYDSGNFSLANFYERRTRRILPALVVVIICCLPFALAWMTPVNLKIFGESVTAVALFSSNLIFWLQNGYFAAPSETKPLLHTWSLAVEEQFYLILPILLFGGLRYLRRIAVIAGAVIAWVASLVLSEVLANTHASANFFFAPSRAWELLTGVLCAFALKERKVLPNDALAFGGLFLLLGSIILFQQGTPSPSLYTLAPVLGTSLLILYARHGTKTAALLSHRSLVAVGLLSYSAYLWHQPLFAFSRLRTGNLSLASKAGLCLATFILAYLSWRFVERPFRSIKLVANARSVFAASFACTSGLALLGVGIYLAHGLPRRIAPSGPSYAELGLDEKTEANMGLNAACEGSFTLSSKCRTANQPEVLLWGDSHAMQLAQALLASEPSVRLIQHTKSVCSPILNLALTNRDYPPSWSKGCIAFNAEVKSSFKYFPTIRYAVLSSPFEISTGNVVDERGKVSASQNLEPALFQFRATVEALRRAGILPVVISSPPAENRNVTDCLIRRAAFSSVEDCRIHKDNLGEQFRASSRFLAAASEFVPVIRLEDYLCGSFWCRTNVGSTFLYNDGHHLSSEGSKWLGQHVPLMRIARDRARSFTRHATLGCQVEEPLSASAVRALVERPCR